jgi:hypothetical protein
MPSSKSVVPKITPSASAGLQKVLRLTLARLAGASHGLCVASLVCRAAKTEQCSGTGHGPRTCHRAARLPTVTDLVWVAIEAAVRAGLDDDAVLTDPPKTEEEVMWLAATIADHVCATLPTVVYQTFRWSLEEGR